MHVDFYFLDGAFLKILSKPQARLKSEQVPVFFLNVFSFYL